MEQLLEAATQTGWPQAEQTGSERIKSRSSAVGYATRCLDVARHDNWLRYNVIPAMEFALSRGCGRKPRELMTPS